MKKIVLVVTALSIALGVSVLVQAARTQLSWSVQSQARTLPPNGAAPDPPGVVKAYYRALNSRWLDAALKLLSDDIVFRSSRSDTSTGMELVGIRPIRQYLQSNVMGSYYELKHVTVRGDTVNYTLIEWSGSSWARPSDMPPTMRRCSAVVRGGRIQSLEYHKF